MDATHAPRWTARLPRGAFLGARPDRTLVGREAELSRVADALDVASDGQGRVVALVGEPGVGKTRLAQEASLLASARAFRVLVGRCYEERASLPLSPVVEALRAAVATAPDVLREQLPRRWPELGELLDKRGSALAGSFPSESDDTRLRLFDSIATLLQELASSAPVALLLDDLHWADTTSLALLLHLARDLAAEPVIVLVTYREIDAEQQPALSAAVRDLARERLLERIPIRGLDLARTNELIRSRVDDPVPDEFVSQVYSRTAGNPFFIEELLSTLHEQHLLSGVTGGEALPLPDTVRAVVDQRVRRLGERAHAVLRLASVLGQEFELPILLRATAVPEEEVLCDLEAALSARLIQERLPAQTGRFGFVHALVHQTLYEDQPLQRRRLHARAGEAIEQLRGQRPDAAAELARHFLASGDSERAIRYSVAAGDHAVALYAHAEAAQHYRQAIDLLVDTADTAQLAHVRCKLAGELTSIRPHDDVIITLFEDALAEFERLGDVAGQARAHQGMAVALDQLGHEASVLLHMDAALRLAPDQATAEHVGLLLDAVEDSYIAGRVAVASHLVARAKSIVDRLDDASLRVRVLMESAALEAWRSLPAALDMLTRAAPLARQAEDWRALCKIHHLAATFWLDAGEWERSRSAYQEMSTASARQGDVSRVVFSWSRTAFTCIELGAWDEGRSAVARGAEHDPGGRNWAQIWLAYRAWLEGRPEDALDELRTYVAVWRPRELFIAIVVGLSTLADWALQLDHVAEAQAAASEALERVLQRNWHSTAEPAAPLAEALVLADTEDAQQRIQELEQLAAKYQKRVGDPQFLRARGILHHRRGENESAIEVLQRSVEVARAQGAMMQRGRTLAVLAEVAASLGDARLTSAATAELDAIVRSVGPEIGRLTWAQPRAAAALTPVRARYPDGLTQREAEVLRLISVGSSNVEIAEQLVLSVRTVERHITNIYAKIGARGRADATAYALRHELD